MALSTHAQPSFGTKSAAYDQYRPSYTPSIVQELLEQTRVAGVQNARIVDLGAGTGKLTEALAARPEGFRITAIEPLAGMREVLTAKGLPNVQVVEGTAAETGLESESVDAVFIAQAFHWFDNRTALVELHRILQPHGALGLVWNVEDYKAPQSWPASTPWEKHVRDILGRTILASGDTQPRFRDGKWRDVFDAQRKKTPLSLLTASDDEQLFALPLGEHKEPFEFVASKAAAWARFATQGHVAALAEPARERVREEFEQAINGEDVQTNDQGQVTLHGFTYAAWTSKIPSEGRSSLLGVERPGA